MKIAILIPCYNEELTIGKVIKDFKAELPDADIYVFDNNSNDNSAAIAKENGAVVLRETQQGKGFVVRSMFSKIDADIYVLVDGDDTYPADSVKELLQPIIDHKAEMVVGDRLSSTYFEENTRRMHNSGNRLVRGLINLMFHSHVKDVLSGYRVFSKNFVKNFPVLSEGFEIETEITIHALERKYPISEIPIKYRDRPSNSTSKLNTFSDGMRVLKMLTLLFKDYKPLIFFTSISVIIFIAAIIIVAPVLKEYWETGLVPRFPTLIVSCFMIITAIMLEVTGIILNTIAKSNRRIYELLRLHQ